MTTGRKNFIMVAKTYSKASYSLPNRTNGKQLKKQLQQEFKKTLQARRTEKNGATQM